jgi:hypothetical protein
LAPEINQARAQACFLFVLKRLFLDAIALQQRQPGYHALVTAFSLSPRFPREEEGAHDKEGSGE